MPVGALSFGPFVNTITPAIHTPGETEGGFFHSLPPQGGDSLAIGETERGFFHSLPPQGGDSLAVGEAEGGLPTVGFNPCARPPIPRSPLSSEPPTPAPRPTLLASS
jgi:hypothetical protein